MASCWEATKRRKVFQLTAAYAVVAWLLAHVVATVEEPLSLSDWFAPTIIVSLVAFPIAITLVWSFAVAPPGTRPSSEPQPGARAAHPVGRRLGRLMHARVLLAVVIGAGWLAPRLLEAQTLPVGQTPIPGQFPAYTPARTADDKPDLNGIWQALTTANWDLEAHAAAPGPYPNLLGAWGAQPGGLSIVEGGTIPYQPWALDKRQKNFESRTTVSVPGDGVDPPLGDPELKCWMPGVPRSMYMPFPLQIVQTPEAVLIAHEFNGTARIVRMNWDEESPVDNTFFMGWSRGHWDGDTLVIDVTGLNENNRLDRAGNFYSAAVHVVERLTLVSPYHLMYEATIEDPTVYTRPWRIRFPLYRRMEENAQLMEFKCQPFVEELLYGQFTKTSTN